MGILLAELSLGNLRIANARRPVGGAGDYFSIEAPGGATPSLKG
jgi:hypothetical protein